MSESVWLDYAHSKLRNPPALERIRRPGMDGDVVAEFVLPLDLCEPTNRTRHRAAFALAKKKTELFKRISWQAVKQGLVGRRMLTGRPQVLAVRFSSVEPDKYADWGKSAIDMLCAKTERSPKRIGLIKDDSPTFADVHQWWEPAPAGSGFVYLQVRKGRADGN